MGTRHLIEVKIDGEIKVAQYGQWDGYPTGQGATIAEFLHNGMKKKVFEEKLKKCCFFPDDQRDFAYKVIQQVEDWENVFPWMSRDASADVLEYIQDSPNGLVLIDESEFAGTANARPGAKR